MGCRLRTEDDMKPFRSFVAAVLWAIIPGATAQAQDKIEKPDLVLGVGGKSSLYYLPLTLAERLGYFKEQGLNVTITDFGGGSKSLQSLIGGFPRGGGGSHQHPTQDESQALRHPAGRRLGLFPRVGPAGRAAKSAPGTSLAGLQRLA